MVFCAICAKSFMLRHLLNRKFGFVRPLSRDEVFVNESIFQLIAPWNDLGVIEGIDIVCLKSKKGGCDS